MKDIAARSIQLINVVTIPIVSVFCVIDGEIKGIALWVIVVIVNIIWVGRAAILIAKRNKLLLSIRDN